MATKKTDSKSTAPKAAAKKAAPAKKAPKASPTEKSAAAKAPRHPKARVGAAHGSKADLAKALAGSVVRSGQDAGDVETQLKTASNAQLLRLSKVVETVKAKWGNRDKLIAAIGSAANKSKDKDYLAKLESYSLPQLVDIATAGERRART